MKLKRNKLIKGTKIRRLIFEDTKQIDEFKEKEDLILVACRLIDKNIYNEFGGKEYILLAIGLECCGFFLSRKASCWRLEHSVFSKKEYDNGYVLVQNIMKPLYYRADDDEGVVIAEAVLNILLNNTKDRVWLAASKYDPTRLKYIIS